MCARKPIQADLTTGWLTGFVPQAGPRYLQIADALEQAMRDGCLSPGDRLPPQRHLAAHLKVDLTTVTRAYEEAKRRRLIVARRTRGTFVASHGLMQAPLFDLSMNIPPPPDGIDLDQLFKQGIAEVLARADRTLLTTYHLEGGRLETRKAGAQWMEPMLGKVDPAHVVVTPGSQAALAGLLLALTQPGSAILTEPIIYPGLLAVAAQFGRRVVPVDADEHGMLPDGIRRACRTLSAQVIYLNPTLQNPNAVTMPEYRRKEVAALAREYSLCIIEDDPSWLTAEAAPPPVAHFAPAHVHYISTLSKCLTPGLRVAFVTISDPGMRSRFIAALRSFALMTAPLTSALATQWIRDGSALSLLKGVREETRARHRLAREALAELYEGAGTGLHLWLRLPTHWSAARLTRAAAKDGLLVTPAGVFSTTADTPNSLRISLGGIPDRERLMTGLQRLAQLVKHQPNAFDEAVI
jgi:DNA-binding transcriptional MocR family regulator